MRDRWPSTATDTRSCGASPAGRELPWRSWGYARFAITAGEVERTAGTFQDRLVTELRLAGVTTIDEANEAAPLPAALQREAALKRWLHGGPGPDTLLPQGGDNTVKYNWRTLQLLPGKERPSYAGSVHEGLDGQLLVQ